MSLLDTSLIVPYFHTYINYVKDQEMLPALTSTHRDTHEFMHSVDADKGDYAYAEGKWTVKQVFQHMIDTERVFAYRAMCMARGDGANLPGFDQDIWSNNDQAGGRRLVDIISEFGLTREATLAMFSSFNDDQLQKTGKANGNPLTVVGCGYIIAGHEAHHMKVLKERYF